MEYTYSLPATHCSELLEYLNEQRKHQNENLCDVCFTVGNDVVYAHRCVLAVCSAYFQGLLSGAFLESQGDGGTSSKMMELDLTDSVSNIAHLDTLLTAAYTGSLKLSTENITGVTELACFLLVERVRVVCESFLLENLSMHNCISYLKLAWCYDLHPLFKACRHLLENRFHDHFIYQPLMLTVPAPCLKQLFRAFCYVRLQDVIQFLSDWVEEQAEYGDLSSSRDEKIAAACVLLTNHCHHLPVNPFNKVVRVELSGCDDVVGQLLEHCVQWMQLTDTEMPHSSASYAESKACTSDQELSEDWEKDHNCQQCHYEQVHRKDKKSCPACQMLRRVREFNRKDLELEKAIASSSIASNATVAGDTKTSSRVESSESTENDSKETLSTASAGGGTECNRPIIENDIGENVSIGSLDAKTGPESDTLHSKNADLDCGNVGENVDLDCENVDTNVNLDSEARILPVVESDDDSNRGGVQDTGACEMETEDKSQSVLKGQTASISCSSNSSDSYQGTKRKWLSDSDSDDEYKIRKKFPAKPVNTPSHVGEADQSDILMDDIPTRDVLVAFVPGKGAVSYFTATDCDKNRPSFIALQFHVCLYDITKRRWLHLGEAVFPGKCEEKDNWQLACVNCKAYFCSVQRQVVHVLDLHKMTWHNLNCRPLLHNLTFNSRIRSWLPIAVNGRLYALVSDKKQMGNRNEDIVTHQRYFRLEDNDTWTAVADVEHTHTATPLTLMTISDNQVYVVKATIAVNVDKSMLIVREGHIFDPVKGTVSQFTASTYAGSLTRVLVRDGVIHIIDSNCEHQRYHADTQKWQDVGEEDISDIKSARMFCGESHFPCNMHLQTTLGSSNWEFTTFQSHGSTLIELHLDDADRLTTVRHTPPPFSYSSIMTACQLSEELVDSASPCHYLHVDTNMLQQ